MDPVILSLVLMFLIAFGALLVSHRAMVTADRSNLHREKAVDAMRFWRARAQIRRNDTVLRDRFDAPTQHLAPVVALPGRPTPTASHHTPDWSSGS